MAKKYRTLDKWLEDNGIDPMPADTVPAEWFLDRGLPMIVECCCCTTTMALPSALIDNNDMIYCENCAG